MDESTNCVICLDHLPNETGVSDCGHIFCKTCISKWLETHSFCPLCRKELSRVRIFYRSFYIGQDIKFDKKTVRKDETEEENYSETQEEVEYSNEETEFYQLSKYGEPGTFWNNGLRRSNRCKNKQECNEIDQAINVFRQMIKNNKRNKMKAFLLGYVNQFVEQRQIQEIEAEEIIKTIEQQMNNNSSLFDKKQISKLVEIQIIQNHLDKRQHKFKRSSKHQPRVD